MIQLTPPLDNPESGRRMNPHAARSHFPISPHQAVSPVTAWSTNLWRPGLVLFSVSQQLFQNGSHGPIALFSLGPQKIRKRFLEAKNHGRRLRSWLCPAPFGHSHRYRYAYIHMYIRYRYTVDSEKFSILCVLFLKNSNSFQFISYLECSLHSQDALL